jgi:hypothetical protein
MSTQTKIIARFALELTRETDPLKAAWIACRSLAEEAREMWGDDVADTVYRVSADIIADAMLASVEGVTA